jgi:hypothetical protein
MKLGEVTESTRGRGATKGKRGRDRGGAVGRVKGDVTRKDEKTADYDEENKLWPQKSFNG